MIGIDLGGTKIKQCRPEFIDVQSPFLKTHFHSVFLSNDAFRNSTSAPMRRQLGRLFAHAGLEITNTNTGEKLLLPWAFESSVREQDIFVFCLSLTKSEELAREFKADVCVEILRPERLLAGIRGALKRRPRIKNKQLIHGPITYYSPIDPPNAIWAVPEQVTMRKTTDYQRQQEFRIAFSVNDAFRVNNVGTQLSATPGAQSPSLDGHPQEILKIGTIRGFCSIHSFS